jgi:hypothetical protein
MHKFRKWVFLLHKFYKKVKNLKAHIIDKDYHYHQQLFILLSLRKDGTLKC